MKRPSSNHPAAHGTIGMPPADFAGFVAREAVFINELARKIRR